MYQTKNEFSGLFKGLFITIAFCSCIFIVAYVYSYCNPDVTESEITVGQLILAISVASVIIVLSSFAAYWINGFYTRCPHCHKKYAMEEQNKEWIRDYLEEKKRTITNGAGTHYEYTQYRTDVYHLNRKCKYCGGEDFIEKKEKKQCRG